LTLGDSDVASGVHDQGGAFDLGCRRRYVELGEGVEKPDDVLDRCRRSLEFGEGLPLLVRCPADDVLGRRWLVQQCDVPFIADESAVTPADVTREILGGAATAVSIKTARTGFTYSQRVHHLAEGLGIEVVMGNQIDGQLGSMCTVAFGAAFRLTSQRAGELSNFLNMSDDLLTEPLQIHNGELAVRPDAGLGVEIDPDKLDHYRIDR
jgi:L-alanine-DL-glutamate epimerase-like enolase superfamily enzyme